jgi:hypothetical protein
VTASVPLVRVMLGTATLRLPADVVARWDAEGWPTDREVLDHADTQGWPVEDGPR